MNHIAWIPWVTSTAAKKLSPKITLHFKVLCESKAMLPMYYIYKTANIHYRFRTRATTETLSKKRKVNWGHWSYIFSIHINFHSAASHYSSLLGKISHKYFFLKSPNIFSRFFWLVCLEFSILLICLKRIHGRKKFMHIHSLLGGKH